MSTPSTSYRSASEDRTVPESERSSYTMPVNTINIGNNSFHPYPDINMAPEIIHSSTAYAHQMNKSKVMLSVPESLLKRIVRTYFEENLSAALTEAQITDNVLIQSTAKFVLSLVNLGNNVKYLWRPYLKNATNVNRDSTGPIRCICWHPNTFKLAVAASDDSIRVYTDETGIVIPVLKYGLQKGITSMAWRPFASAELAVGCQNGVLLWTLHHHSYMAPLSQVQQLKCDNHSPVTSVAWNTNGSLLVTASVNDSNLILWDVDSGRNTALKRIGYPCSLVKWSPDGSLLFSATVGSAFHVWSTEKWVPEQWNLGVGGSIQSAVWSPCGSHALIITTEDQYLYSLKFTEAQLSSSVSKHAMPIMDLRNNESFADMGGRPLTLAWDPQGKYLAVAYKDSSRIAVFQTLIVNRNLSISFLCILNGLSTDSFPTNICFEDSKSKRTPQQAVLTICWASGRVQYFPFS